MTRDKASGSQNARSVLRRQGRHLNDPGRRAAARAAAVIGGLLLGASVASAQANTTSWDLDAHALALFSPGVGAATNAEGLGGSVALVRSRTLDESGGRRFIGVTAIAATMWARSAEASPATREHLVLAGPTRGIEDRHGRLLLQILAGVRRVTGFAGSSSSTKTMLAAGAGMAFDLSPRWRVLEIDWLISPGSPTGAHRLILSAGYSFGTRLTPRGATRCHAL